jgi:hypothetical protein
VYRHDIRFLSFHCFLPVCHPAVLFAPIPFPVDAAACSQRLFLLGIQLAMPGAAFGDEYPELSHWPPDHQP